MVRKRRRQRVVLARRRGKGRRHGRLIYSVWDPVQKPYVVVKRYASHPKAMREIRAMRAHGDCPHLVRFLRHFVRQGKTHIVMERVPGRTLKHLVRTRGPFPPQKVIAYTMNILKGVTTLHAAGYVHGDLHSGNVLVAEPSEPALKIIDLQHAVPKNGLGKAVARRRMSRPPAKMPPEARQRIIDDRYDIYGVGFMCACMTLGRELRRIPGPVPKRH